MSKQFFLGLFLLAAFVFLAGLCISLLQENSLLKSHIANITAEPAPVVVKGFRS